VVSGDVFSAEIDALRQGGVGISALADSVNRYQGRVRAALAAYADAFGDGSDQISAQMKAAGGDVGSGVVRWSWCCVG
jgi:hypothetical protein